MAVGKKKKIVKLFINIARKQQLGDGIKCYKHLLHSTHIYIQFVGERHIQ